MDDALKHLWEYRTGSDVCDVAITPEANLVAVGAEDSHVYALSRDGQLLWKYKTQDWVRSVAVSADGDCVLAGSDDHSVYAFSGTGQLLWKHEGQGQVWALAISPDGEYIVAGVEDHSLQALSRTGQSLWKYSTEGDVLSTAISADGEYVAAGTSDDCVYLLSRTGRLLWKYEAGDAVNAVALSADAERVVAGSDDEFVHALSRDGRLLWKYETNDDVYAVAISDGGEYTMAGGDDEHLYLLDCDGRLLAKENLGHWIRGVTATPTGQHIATGTWGSRVCLFENPAAPDWLTGQGARPHDPERVIRRVHEAYIANPHGGRALWFEEFDRLLAHSHFDACKELLEEAREEGYGFGTGEYRYLDSREGALYLRHGIALQKEGEFAEAEEHYLRGMEAQKRARYTVAQGEVQMALHSLAEEMATKQSDPFLDTIDQELTVLGDAEAVLCGRLDTAGEEECGRILCAAVELRLVSPLLEALEHPTGRVSMMAAAALARFRHDGFRDRLLAGMRHQQWFTRWRSSEALGWAEGLPPELTPVIGSALEDEPDPEVRRTLALSLGRLKDRQATPSLAMALADSDADVRWAAANALSQAGDRKALAGLRQAAKGNDFLGRSVREAAQETIGEIEGRYPLPKVHQFQTCRLHNEHGGLQPAALFWAGEAILVAADVAGAHPTTRLRLQVHDPSGSCVHERLGQYGELCHEEDSLRTALRPEPTTGIVPPATPLVEILDGDTREGQDGQNPQLEIGMRVRYTGEGEGSARLRVGDTGTVRTASIGGGSLGVQWDRGIGGHSLEHDGLGDECPDGHGWYVTGGEVSAITDGDGQDTVAADSLVIRIPVQQSGGLHPGQYVVNLDVYDADCEDYERAAEAHVRVLAEVAVREVVTSLGVGDMGQPARRSPTIALSSEDVHCCVALADAPSGTPVKAVLRDPHDRTVAESLVEAKEEGTQWVAVPLAPGRWVQGTYRIGIQVGKSKEITLNLRAVDRVVIQDIVTCRAVNDLQEAQQPLSVFSQETEAVYCSVALSPAPASTKVAVRWFHTSRRRFRLRQNRTMIHEMVAALEVGGEQHVAFSLGRPQEGWPPGRYGLDAAIVSSGEGDEASEDGGIRAFSTDSKTRWHTVRFHLQ